MEQAIWKDNLISAYEVAANYELEKLVRKASSAEELRCLDTECQSPILRYCHGDIKEAYFAHKCNSDCVYDQYERKTPSHIKGYCRRLAEILRGKGYSLELMKRFDDKHIAHMILYINGKKLAIEFITTKLGVNKIDELKEL